MGGNRPRSHPPPSETFHLIALLHALGWDLGALHDEDNRPTVTLRHPRAHQPDTRRERRPRIRPHDQTLPAASTPEARATRENIRQDIISSHLPIEPYPEHPPQSRGHQKIQITSPSELPALSRRHHPQNLRKRHRRFPSTTSVRFQGLTIPLNHASRR
jgi:hypothetical protein